MVHSQVSPFFNVFICVQRSKQVATLKNMQKLEKFNGLEHEKERSEGASSKEVFVNKFSFVSFDRTPRKRSCIWKETKWFGLWMFKICWQKRLHVLKENAFIVKIVTFNCDWLQYEFGWTMLSPIVCFQFGCLLVCFQMNLIGEIQLIWVFFSPIAFSILNLL